jgi:hypothetical protein
MHCGPQGSCSVADPGSGTFSTLGSGSGIGFFPDLGIRIYISENLITFVWGKNT